MKEVLTVISLPPSLFSILTSLFHPPLSSPSCFVYFPRDESNGLLRLTFFQLKSHPESGPKDEALLSTQHACVMTTKQCFCKFWEEKDGQY